MDAGVLEVGAAVIWTIGIRPKRWPASGWRPEKNENKSKGNNKSKNFPRNEKAKTSTMNSLAQLEHRASNRRSTHESESSYSLCDRLSRTRDDSQRQLPTDHDYATSTRGYQTDQSSFKLAPTVAGPVLDKRQKQRQQQKQPHNLAGIDRVTPYQRVSK
jgi:hypothetical protein